MNPCKVEMTKYNILRKGKVIFWDVSESELFDRLEDYAVESYVTGSPKPSEITNTTFEYHFPIPLQNNQNLWSNEQRSKLQLITISE